MKPSGIVSQIVAELLSSALSYLQNSVRKYKCFNGGLNRIYAAMIAGGMIYGNVFYGTETYAAVTPNPAPGNSVTVTGTGNTGTIGTGSPYNNNTVIVDTDAELSGGKNSAISLGNDVNITVRSGAEVSNNTASSGGYWSAGNNVVEFNSNGILTVESGGVIRALGTSSNAEAVNVMGYGNKVENHGTISALNAAAIWFEDRTNGAANTIDNYGTIQAGNGDNPRNVIGNQGSSAVHFINESGGIVYGSLKFAGGNDMLDLYPGSVITGGFDGGAGTNTLMLNGAAGSSDKLSGSISNFSTLTKQGEGQWTLTGSIGNTNGKELAVNIEQGTLTLTGNNTNFKGTVTVDTDGTLEARAQSLPSAMTDNGKVRFVQTDEGTYGGLISGTGSVEKTEAGWVELTGDNTYSGGTTIYGGTVAVGKDAALGTANSGILLDGGALEFTNSFNTQRFITLETNNGTIQTDDSVSQEIGTAITGSGNLTKSGDGSLILTADNTYGGSSPQTTVNGGSLVIGNNGTTGSISGDVANNGSLIFNRSNNYTFDGTISGSGGIEQKGDGFTTLTGNNTYTGTTTINSGRLFINGDQSAATGTITVSSGGTLSG
ncbi:MAG: autotransporter-associated beta strand repeat-containing protein, partial [Planctomycetaceae bacterium]|nr:autotransporter-associated beta strand repeat-containing protein [Planctomycetaceae bacterium]